LREHFVEVLRECPGCLQAGQTAFEVDGILKGVFVLKSVQECVKGKKRSDEKQRCIEENI